MAIGGNKHSAIWLKGKKFFRALWIIVFDYFILLFTRRIRGNYDVLVARLDAIGDFVLWIESAKALRQLYADRKIILLANETWADWASSLKLFDEVWPLNRRHCLSRPIYRWHVLRRIRSHGFSTLVSPIMSREFLLGDSIARTSGIKERIGVLPCGGPTRPIFDRFADRWYTRLIPINVEISSEITRNSVFVQCLGATWHKTGLPSINPPENTLPTALLGVSYYVLIPGASWSHRRWPADRFALLAKHIFDFSGWIGIVCGSTDEVAIAEEIIRQTDAPVQNWCGCTSLVALTTIVSQARIVIGNETGGIHLAATVGTPAISITGGGHWGRFLPYPVMNETLRPNPKPIVCQMDCFGCDWKCRYKVETGAPVLCISNIFVDDVWKEVHNNLCSTLKA